MKTFSVVVPNLHSVTIHRTIESLECQRFDRDRFEVIVVGMDRFGLVRESDLVRFDRSERPLLPGQARNRGVASTRGAILAFIDADCIARPDWLKVLAARFEDERVTVVGGGVSFDERNYWTLSDNLGMFYDYRADLPAGERRQLPSLNLAMRREAFQQVGGFDEHRPSSEDSILTIWLRRNGHRLHFEPSAVVVHDPPRSRASDMLRHGFDHGKYSTKVDPCYASSEGLVWPLRTRLGVLLSAPFLAAVVTARVLSQPGAWKYWRTAPAVWLMKLAWCAGAACRP